MLMLILAGTGLGFLWHSVFVTLKPTIPWVLFVTLYPIMIGLSPERFAEIDRHPHEPLLYSARRLAETS